MFLVAGCAGNQKHTKQFTDRFLTKDNPVDDNHMYFSTQEESRAEFERQVRDALANLFDLTSLQTHPLLQYLEPGPIALQSRGEILRERLHNAIMRLRPSDATPQPGAAEWRPFIILNDRYLEGARIQDIQEMLAISERQFRREQGRALQAVATLIWDNYARQQLKANRQLDIKPVEHLDHQDDFPVIRSDIDVEELMHGVVETMQHRAGLLNVDIDWSAPQNLPLAFSNRVILRQVIIGLLSFAINECSGERISVPVTAAKGFLNIAIEFPVDTLPPDQDLREKIRSILLWAETIEAEIRWKEIRNPDSIRLEVLLYTRQEQVVLVVDDQETALRMYQRYLAQTGIRLVGLRSGEQVVEAARELQPNVIALDVMLPDMDGWEVLQSLRANPGTHHIPVIICTVWEEPDLAISLGASCFLKKPISQKVFLSALARFGLE